MLGMVAVAFLSRRRVEAGRIVAVVALLVFAIDPVSLMMPGFALSFAAVVVLLWFARRYWQPRLGLRVYQLLVMQFILLFGLMPMTVFIFQRIAITAPLSRYRACVQFHDRTADSCQHAVGPGVEFSEHRIAANVGRERPWH